MPAMVTRMVSDSPVTLPNAHAAAALWRYGWRAALRNRRKAVPPKNGARRKRTPRPGETLTHGAQELTLRDAPTFPDDAADQSDRWRFGSAGNTPRPRQPGQLDWDANGRLIVPEEFRAHRDGVNALAWKALFAVRTGTRPRVGVVEDSVRAAQVVFKRGVAGLVALPRTIDEISAYWAGEQQRLRQ